MASWPRRRELLVAGAAIAATALGGPVLAQSASTAPGSPRQKGPRVWLDMDQAELDAAYDQAEYAPNLRQVLKRYEVNSEASRRRLGNPERLAYGPTGIERLDVYRTKQANAPINIFLHGGSWRFGLARDYAFPSEMFVAAGAHLVVPDFVSIVDASGNLALMAEQVCRAIAWVRSNARSFGGDPDRIYVSGHSSGAHLAAVALTSDWQKDFNLPRDVLKGGLLCSGIYDLKAPRLSFRSNYVKFTDAMEERLSPARHVQALNAPVIVAYGSLESPEFQRQAREFAAAISAAGKPVQLLVGEACNHFEVIETFANPYGLLGRAVREQMSLS